MKKLLLFLVMFGVLIGMSSSVLAVDQGLNVTIGENITLLISPDIVDFGIRVPGNNYSALNGPITFDATGSNVNVTVTVSAVTGFPFNSTTLRLDGDPTPVGLFWLLVCKTPLTVCTYDVAGTLPTLDIPTGASQGNHLGTITYTVTGPPPPQLE